MSLSASTASTGPSSALASPRVVVVFPLPPLPPAIANIAEAGPGLVLEPAAKTSRASRVEPSLVVTATAGLAAEVDRERLRDGLVNLL